MGDIPTFCLGNQQLAPLQMVSFWKGDELKWDIGTPASFLALAAELHVNLNVHEGGGGGF